MDFSLAKLWLSFVTGGGTHSGIEGLPGRLADGGLKGAAFGILCFVLRRRNSKAVLGLILIQDILPAEEIRLLAEMMTGAASQSSYMENWRHLHVERVAPTSHKATRDIMHFEPRIAVRLHRLLLLHVGSTSSSSTSTFEIRG